MGHRYIRKAADARRFYPDESRLRLERAAPQRGVFLSLRKTNRNDLAILAEPELLGGQYRDQGRIGLICRFQPAPLALLGGVPDRPPGEMPKNLRNSSRCPPHGCLLLGCVGIVAELVNHLVERRLGQELCPIAVGPFLAEHELLMLIHIAIELGAAILERRPTVYKIR